MVRDIGNGSSLIEYYLFNIYLYVNLINFFIEIFSYAYLKQNLCIETNSLSLRFVFSMSDAKYLLFSFHFLST